MTFRYNRFLQIGLTLIPLLPHRIGLIYNPFAGGLKGGGRARLDVAVRVLEQAGAKVEIMPTPGPQLAGELAQKAVAAGCDLIVAAGGDGTINEAAHGIAGSHVLFGILPAGTANVLANEIGFSNRPDHAAAQLLDAVPVRIAMGALDREGEPRRNFVLMAGVGLDARIVYELDLELKGKLGKLAYWHGGFKQLGRPVPRFHVSVNGAQYCASFALITRVRNYGGDFEIARRIRLTDDDFEVVIFQNRQWQDYLRFFTAVMANRLQHTSGVTIVRASEVKVDAPEDERIYIQTDGEAVGVLPATISAVPDALTLLMPRRYAEGLGGPQP
ncbi:MAG TPA: diacylglycerol kinase family protein [Bryobacteraceae bacterium]|nr:diacylglycerol kinase family protein [Bryobacteraceae bacterium]